MTSNTDTQKGLFTLVLRRFEPKDFESFPRYSFFYAKNASKDISYRQKYMYIYG